MEGNNLINSPYKGKFKVTQQFKGSLHDGLDLVGISDKTVYSTVNGVVERAGWENVNDKKQGFGLYVRIKQNGSEDRYYFGHLSKIAVKVGDKVKIDDPLGTEGSTGYSTGSHCHYCVRENASKQNVKDVAKISGIPNKIGTYQNPQYYLVKRSWKNVTVYKTRYITQARIFASLRNLTVYTEQGKTVYSFRK